MCTMESFHEHLLLRGRCHLWSNVFETSFGFYRRDAASRLRLTKFLHHFYPFIDQLFLTNIRSEPHRSFHFFTEIFRNLLCFIDCFTNTDDACSTRAAQEKSSVMFLVDEAEKIAEDLC